MYGGSVYAGAPYAGGGTIGGTVTPPAGPTIPQNQSSGRIRDGLGLVSVSVAVVVPTHLGTRVDKAIAYPTPDLVAGRPT